MRKIFDKLIQFGKSIKTKILLLGLLILWVVITSLMRINSESKNKTVEIALDWDEVVDLCQKNKYPVNDFFERCRAIGAASAVINEKTLCELEEQEKLIYFSGAEYSRLKILDLINQESALRPNSIAVSDKKLKNQILRQFDVRYGIAYKVSKAGKYSVISPAISSQFTPAVWNENMYLGFSDEETQFLSDFDFKVVYRPQNSGNPMWLFEDDKPENFSGILWDNKEVSGYSGRENLVIEGLKNSRTKFMNIEFTSVMGIKKLKQQAADLMVNGHTISVAELNQYQNSDYCLYRLIRAAKERSIRFMLFHFWQQKPVEENISYLRKTAQKLKKTGFKLDVSLPPPYPSRTDNYLWLLTAMFSAIITPIIALYFGRKLRNPFYSFLLINLISIFGGLVVSSSLYDVLFMQKAVEIPGIKLIMLLPVVFIFFHIYSYEKVKSFLQLELKIRDLIFAAILISFAAVIFARSGNNSADWMHLDQSFREFIENLLFVRPRTKEFLFGQPLMLLGLYFRKPLFIWLGMVGQVSIMNTFLHVHTPLMISLTRTLYGIFIGMVLAYSIIRIYEYAISKRKNS